MILFIPIQKYAPCRKMSFTFNDMFDSQTTEHGNHKYEKPPAIALNKIFEACS